MPRKGDCAGCKGNLGVRKKDKRPRDIQELEHDILPLAKTLEIFWRGPISQSRSEEPHPV